VTAEPPVTAEPTTEPEDANTATPTPVESTPLVSEGESTSA
jgi:hypothetical protein